jgi:hypothetical protein
MGSKKVITTTVSVLVAVALAACGQADLHGAPNVKGLSLPDAEQQLSGAGYEASVKTDAMFGVIVPSHYSVCSEDSPNGKLVPIDAEKQC